jgi:hypothetical protein
MYQKREKYVYLSGFILKSDFIIAYRSAAIPFAVRKTLHY